MIINAVVDTKIINNTDMHTKSPVGIPTELFSDSNRIFIIKAFAILVKCITFVYQIVTVVNSHWIATELR
jgi:hypothetical protein